ncbi:PLP-dependent aminotransferase family protein [Pseudoruegeria sp. SK021]|uniref:MocR-like ectoine utilization transcription factor EhuR n=1 Tax=Pseudoruegeria sp. SK021 TaxID=1933035 RepID=UPI000A22D0E5|nr:PLP-dependent aminotransferase family protein [Pseudoruegeria sp. SK021]OSP56419.1 GntR family transcriptional regulator [Pseudoruegeria sp. SK021]
MTIWPPKREELSRPAYHSLAQRLVQAIDAGEVPAGTRLPTHRALAFDLGLSVQTVSRAYEELARLGVITAAVGRGSFVMAGTSDARLPWQRPHRGEDLIDCSLLVPVTGDRHADAATRLFRDLADNLPHDALFSFRPNAALQDHRRIALSWLEKCGLVVDSERVLPTNGNTSAMTVALMSAAKPGDLILAEELGHHTLPSLTSALGLKLSGLPMDKQGILPQAIDRACENGPVAAVLVQPAGVGPAAAVMGLERRKQVIEVARKHDIWIVENDSWGPLDPTRLAPLAAMAPERVFYFTGLSKCVLPGLRMAWLVAPASKVSAVRNRHLVTNWMASPLIAESASRWIKNGTAGDLLDWQRAQLKRRNQIAARVLEGLEFSANPYGLHVWLPLLGTWEEHDFVALARHDGIAVAGGSHFTTNGPLRTPAVRICLGGGTEADLEHALKVISRLIRSPAEPAVLEI